MDYPQPLCIRENFRLLNGSWNYKLVNSIDLNITTYDGKITVPYCLESQLSNVSKKLDKQILYYQYSFSHIQKNNKVLLHFQAVDYQCEIYLNKKYVGNHIGGYLPFYFNITKYLTTEANTLEVFVIDNTSDTQQLGKQSLNPKGIFYTSTSGIYDDVWLEDVDENYIKNFKYTTDIYQKKLFITVKTKVDTMVKILIADKNQQIVASSSIISNKQAVINFNQIIYWSVDTPYLYKLILSTDKDKISSYISFRDIKIQYQNNFKRFFLNNTPIFINAVLYQGYWKDSLQTTDTQKIIKDLTLIKKLGFNCIRIHERIAPAKFYYLCDEFGLLVIQDMVSGGYKNPNQLKNLYMLKNLKTTYNKILTKDDNLLFYIRMHRNKKSRELFEKSVIDTITYLHNYNCIIMYTIFNEGWGQFDSTRIGNLAKSLDQTRIYDYTSGWYDQTKGEVLSYHIYFRKIAKLKMDQRLLMISEYGGKSLSLDNQVDSTTYEQLDTKQDFTDYYYDLIINQVLPLISQGLSGVVYTQFNDIESELNGFVTYDRNQIKVDISKINNLNLKLSTYNFNK